MVFCDTGFEVDLDRQIHAETAGCCGVEWSALKIQCSIVIPFISSIRYWLLHFIDLLFLGKKEYRVRIFYSEWDICKSGMNNEQQESM